MHKIKNTLSDKYQVITKITSKEVDPQLITRDALKKGAEVIIASEGDGTLSATTTALINTDVPLEIILRGPANAFAFALGIPK